MSNPTQTTGDAALAYGKVVFERGRVPMEPLDFVVDWADQPSRHKVYPGTTRLPLPLAMPEGPVDLGVHGDPAPPSGRPATLDDVASLLLAYGLSKRRLRFNWNEDNFTKLRFHQAVWARPTASGGGMYPLETYWVAGPSGSLLPGVYHYSTAHHALERLVSGDVSDRVRAALADHPDAVDTDQFLVVAVRFWKNAFKYNSFCYHVVTQDCGALLGSWQLIARGLGLDLNCLLWFDDEALNRVVGLDTEDESVLAVVPLPWGAAPPEPAEALRVERDLGQPVVTRPSWERSKRVIRFEHFADVHNSALVGDAPRPAVEVAQSAAVTEPSGAEVALETLPPDALRTDFSDVLHNRRSSFGTFTAAPALSRAELGTVLASGAAAARSFRCDLKDPGSAPAWTRIGVFANRVDDVEPGAYGYDSTGHGLRLVQPMEVGKFLQSNYFLTNYNLDQVAAVLAIIGRLPAMVDAYGGRGYRMLNAEVGLVAQNIYCAAAAASLGCGAVLGFDNVSLNEALELDDDDERTVLFVLLGHDRAQPGDFEYRLA